MYSELESPLEDRLVFDKSLFDGEDIAKQMGDNQRDNYGLKQVFAT